MTNHSILKLIEKNHSATELRDMNTPNTQVHLKVHPRQCQHSPSTKTPSLKLHIYGKEYIYFKNNDRTSRASQCSKSRSPNKIIETIMSIG